MRQRALYILFCFMFGLQAQGGVLDVLNSCFGLRTVGLMVSQEQARRGKWGDAKPQLAKHLDSGKFNRVYFLKESPVIEGLPRVKLVARGNKEHLQATMQEITVQNIELAREAGFTDFGFPVEIDGLLYHVVEYRGEKDFLARHPSRKEMTTLRRVLSNASKKGIICREMHLENIVGGYPVDFDGMKRLPTVEAATKFNNMIFHEVCVKTGYKSEDFPE